MAATLNRVYLIGNLTRDPELRYLPSGQAVATFSIAVNRPYTLQSGEKKESTSFIKIVAWGRIAETCSEYLSKGRSVLVEGRLESRSWETQDGQKRSTTEVVARNVQFLSRREGEASSRPAQLKKDSLGGPVASEGKTPPLKELGGSIPVDKMDNGSSVEAASQDMDTSVKGSQNTEEEVPF